MTSVQLDYEVSRERASTGIPELDVMLGGKGYFRTSTILVSGAAGTGKSVISASVLNAACGRGEKAILFALEESPSQIIRNMASVGIDLQKWIDRGLLSIRATRPSFYGLEMHLLTMHKQIAAWGPRLVVLDPISSLMNAGSSRDVKSMMVRLFDSLKMQQITGLMTYLTASGRMGETQAGISSLIDTWLEVRDLEMHGERTRALYVIKSRGMAHSNQVREFLLSDAGVRLLDVYAGPDGVLTGSARALQDSRIAAEQELRQAAAKRTEQLLLRKRAALQARITALEAEFASEAEAARMLLSDSESRAERERSERLSASRERTLGRRSGSRPLRAGRGG
jgi:circadian clock protein KaiC